MKRERNCPKNVSAILTLNVLTTVLGCGPNRVGNDIVVVPETVTRTVQAGDVDIDVGVDPRVELMSIVFRLAGNKEYNECEIPNYDKDIEVYFEPYKDHSVVKCATELKKRRGMGYNAPMALAVCAGGVPNLREVVPLDPRPAELDERWLPLEAVKFLKDARSFAKESNFGKFYNDHKRIYDKAISALTQLIESQAHLEWFEEYFGKGTKPHMSVALGFTNGPNNYGVSVVIDGEEHIYSIMGVWNCDPIGNPKFSSEHMGIIHHELCHSYSNPIVFTYSDALRPAGKKMYMKVAEKMHNQAYGDWQTMMGEYVARVCTIQYYKRHGEPDIIERAMKYQTEMGFVGMRELDEVVSEYENKREEYPTFESFFPRVIEFFD